MFKIAFGERKKMLAECERFKQDINSEWDLSECEHEIGAMRACGTQSMAKSSICKIDGPIGPIVKTKIVFEKQNKDLFSLTKYREGLNDEIDIYQGMLKLDICDSDDVFYVNMRVEKYYGYGWHSKGTAYDFDYFDAKGFLINSKGKIKKIESVDYLGNETVRAIEMYFDELQKQLKAQDEKK